jgi:RNA polymerase sigma-70 factor (ECF subfamily)
MRWRARSIRHAADFPPDGEAALRPVPGVGGIGLGGSGLGKMGQDKPGAGKPGLGAGGSGHVFAHLSGRSGGPKTGPGIGSLANGAAKGSSRGNSSAETAQESTQAAQPSGADGVPEDMATLVLDNSAMGAGPASRPDARPDPETGLNAGLDPASDAAIMLRVAAGDEASFNYLVGRYHRAIIHFLFRMVRNQAVAEELAQEVFLRVYRSRAEAKFTTWLYRIATNLAVNHARDTKHERSAQTIYLDAPDEETGTTPDVADDEPSVEQKLMRDERMAAIRTHVMELPERQRMAVLMHKYQGMDYRQIGDVLKLSESATKSLLFRAYQTLRDKLKDFV